MESLRIPNSQCNPEKEEKDWQHHTSQLQTTYEIYSNHNNMVLAYKQTHKSMEYNQELRNKPSHT